MGQYGTRGDMVVHESRPFNAESGLAALTEVLTPTDAFYVRGLGEVPEVDPDAWRLRIHGAVERELELSLSTLREVFAEREVTATLHCAAGSSGPTSSPRPDPRSVSEAPSRWRRPSAQRSSWRGR